MAEKEKLTYNKKETKNKHSISSVKELPKLVIIKGKVSSFCINISNYLT